MTVAGARVPFCFVDVFARRPLTGNPLSLVPDADGLTEPQMQAIARTGTELPVRAARLSSDRRMPLVRASGSGPAGSAASGEVGGAEGAGDDRVTGLVGVLVGPGRGRRALPGPGADPGHVGRDGAD
ncbi:MAG TPA: PhzF family phenazine biosynthesis protein, partial [Streptosporangiaceae bacterium]|nr:PhzF family phenazine biosynthesis protein [Streptosporangiaceae bacterium]